MSNSESPPLVPAEKPRGLKDNFGELAALEEGIISKVGHVYQLWGFERLETPAFEFTGALGKFLPDVDRPNEGVFSFLDDEQWVSLRYDLTAPLARFVAENFNQLPKPYRRWAAGPVWRNEKPGPGRFREFWQCDADTVGSASPTADAEMIAMASSALDSVGAQSSIVNISSRGLLDSILSDAGIHSPRQRMATLRAIDKVDRLGWKGVRDLLGDRRVDESGDVTQGAKLPEVVIERIMSLLIYATDSRARSSPRGAFLNILSNAIMSESSEAALRELVRIHEALCGLAVPEHRARFDISIVRGLEYYTGPVFEAEYRNPFDDSIRYGSVGGGGRYDDLVARFRGERVPATGFSIGVSRLAAVLHAQSRFEYRGPVIVLAMDAEHMGDYFAIASELRAEGIRAEVYLGGGAGMKVQLKYADKRNAPVAVIQGSDELANGTVTLKDLKLGAKLTKNLGEDREAYAKLREQAQVEVPRANVVAAVQQMLAR
jgi:histidyl-tRNA synthetase